MVLGKGVTTFIVVIVVVLTFCLSNSVIISQTLPADEISSIQFLIQQYTSILPLDQAGFCNNGTNDTFSLNFQNITCEFVNGEYHVTQVILYTMYHTGFTITTPIAQLYLPYCNSIQIISYSVTVTDLSYNLLELIKDLPNLKILYIQGDPAITSIPQTQSPPLLHTLTLTNLPIPSIKWPFFPNSTNLTSISMSFRGNTQMIFDSNWYLPSLSSASITVNGTNQNVFNFQTTSFPRLGTIGLYFSEANIVADVSFNLQRLSILNLNTQYSIQPCNVTFISAPSIKLVAIRGPTIFNPPIFSIYQTLSGFSSLANSELSTYPFLNGYPPNIISIEIDESTIQSIPNIQLPPSVNYYILNNNSLLQDIPWNIFDNSPNVKFGLSDSPGISGTIPEEMCDHRLPQLFNTSITVVPDCFWCYQNDSTIFNTTIPTPLNFECPISFNSSQVGLVNGKATLTGNNIGWGYDADPNYKLYPIIPNKKLLLTVTPSFVPVGAMVLRSIMVNSKTPLYNQSLIMIEGGISFNSTQGIRTKMITQSLMLVNISMALFNPYINHTIMIDNRVPCNYSMFIEVEKALICTTLVGYGNHIVNISNHLTSISFTEVFSPYPIIVSSNFDPNDMTKLTLNGIFGSDNIGVNNSVITILVNETNQCQPTFFTQKVINCTLNTPPNNGPASISIAVDQFIFNRSNAIYFENVVVVNGTNLKEQCMNNTNNCFGHGNCQDDGTCKCDQSYNTDDNCRTQFTEVPPVFSESAPTATFQTTDDIKFDFEMISIQELDIDESIIKELPTVNWKSTIQDNTTTLTTVNYQLNTADSTIVPPITQVTAVISFSSESRTINFGPTQQITLNPNSIKLSVNISQWTFESNLSYLRVLFKTIINTNQSYEYGCQEYPIDSLTFDQFESSIQYLRVIRNGIEFNGRFIDYSLADGKPTYSRTQLVSLTSSSSDSDQSIAIIGITLSQCQTCILDPDFSPLLSMNGECDESVANSTKWKIIVGVVVGVVGAAAIGFVIFKLVKQNKFYFIRRSARSSINLKQR